MSGKTIVAQLPPMTSADLERFEAEGGVWGQQRAIRRNQVYIIGAAAASSVAAGTAWTVMLRRNTWFVGALCAPAWALFGAVAGNFVSSWAFPNVASNAETTMMRRVWWSKECAKGWDMSQMNGDLWQAKYPHLQFPHRSSSS